MQPLQSSFCIAFARDCLKKINELHAYSSKLQVTLTELENEKDIISRLIEKISENKTDYDILHCPQLMTHIRKVIDMFSISIIPADRALYKLRSGEELAAEIGDYAAAKLLFEEYYQPQFGADYIVADDSLHFKMPMAIPAFRTSSQSPFIKNKYAQCDRPLAEAMMKLIVSENSGVKFYLKYKLKSICYTFIYEENERNKALDSDNHETKSVTDAICLLLGGDQPATTSFCYNTEFTDSIPKGTYITVIPRKEECISSKSVIEFWKSYMQAPRKSISEKPALEENAAEISNSQPHISEMNISFTPPQRLPAFCGGERPLVR